MVPLSLARRIADSRSQGTLRKVTLGIKEANIQETLLERFVFDLEWLCNPEEIPKAGDDWACVLPLPQSGFVTDDFRSA